MKRILLAVALAVAASRVDAQQDRGRPLILLVHGRGMLDRDTALTRRLWIDGLRSGAATLPHAPLFTDDDVRVVWYADVLDPRSNEGCEYAANDVRAKRDAKADAGLKQLASLAGGLFSALSGLVDDREANSQFRGLAGDAAFLGDARKRCASESRLASAIERARSEARPIILVAHSLGSLVAYDYLSSRPDTALIQRFVTIGSPVGSPDLRRLLIGGDSTERLVMPEAVRDWVNIRNQNDVLAASLSVGREIVTTPPPDEVDSHEMVGYLRASATAREILGGWCAAFASKRPQGCMELGPE